MRYVTRDPIDLDRLVLTVSGPGRGGTAAFVGTVRSGPDDGDVARIDYSAYEDMLEAEFGRIAGDAEARWPQACVAAVHRLGTVAVGEASIAVAAAAPHRAEAFEVCRFVIEEAKKRLPVWKKEYLADGSTRWREDDAWASPSS